MENLNVDVIDQYVTDKMALYNGDSCEIMKAIPDNSIDFSIFSPPFASLYTYNNSDRDLGNCKDKIEFYEHFIFIAKQLFRVIKNGRLIAVHCMNLPTSKAVNGFIGIEDFRGDLIKIFQDVGFIFHSEVCIWKDPVIAMQRTKALGLLYKQLKKDSAMSRQGIADYLIVFRKNGINEEPISHTPEEFSCDLWQKYASPVWFDINQSNTLNRTSAREEKDEKHICLAEGSLVLTQRGYIPIETVQVGIDKTITHTGEWKTIIAKKKTAINVDTIQTKANGVPNLITTPTHKLYAKKSYGAKPKENLKRVNADWIEAKDTQNCYLNLKLPKEIKSDISSQEWWIIGRWLADGHIDSRGHQYFISVANKKLDEFLEKAKNKIGAINRNGENCTQIGLVNLSEKARDFLSRCGKRAENKVIPIEGISLNKELSKSLLDGYLSGDGHISKDKKTYATSVSRALLLGLSLVIAKAENKVSSIYKGRDERIDKIESRKVNCKTEWILCFFPNYSFSVMEDNQIWKKVIDIKETGKKDVWNIEVEDDHSYTAEGCIVKNCPLQLDVIERAITLWTNPNDIVFTPFMGIGSEVYQALKMGRRGVGIELKESYFEQSVRNCQSVIEEENQLNLFEEK